MKTATRPRPIPSLRPATIKGSADGSSTRSAHNPFHRLVDRAALLHLPLHAPGIDPVEELVGKRGDLLGNVVLAYDFDVEASFPVRLLLKTDERIGRHRVRHFDRHVANAAQIVRL